MADLFRITKTAWHQKVRQKPIEGPRASGLAWLECQQITTTEFDLVREKSRLHLDELLVGVYLISVFGSRLVQAFLKER
jgi:hypothetical protein